MEDKKNPSLQEEEKKEKEVVLSDCEIFCGRGMWPGVMAGYCMGCVCNPDNCY